MTRDLPNHSAGSSGGANKENSADMNETPSGVSGHWSITWFTGASGVTKVILVVTLTLNALLIGGVVGGIAYIRHNIEVAGRPPHGVANAAYAAFPVATSLLVASRKIMREMPEKRRIALSGQSLVSLKNINSVLVKLVPSSHDVRLALREQLAKEKFDVAQTRLVLSRAETHRRQAMIALDSEMMAILKMLTDAERQEVARVLEYSPAMLGWKKHRYSR